MAREVITQYIDDLDGGPADGAVTFALDGETYEIDLSEKNADVLRELLAPYITAGSVVRPTLSAGRAPRHMTAAQYTAPTRRRDLIEVRTWLREKGYAVSDRGRVAKEQLAEYDAAH